MVQQFLECFSDTWITIRGENHSPACFFQVFRVHSFLGTQCRRGDPLIPPLQLFELFWILLFSLDNGRNLLWRHRRQEVLPACAVNAIEHKHVCIHCVLFSAWDNRTVVLQKVRWCDKPWFHAAISSRGVTFRRT